ncbi:alkaline shock response membrane anchor protein AmaP [Cellulosimicrobium funkei]|nr:alkaline shock response membrane anchor protein AmaP [Cellulosimicrobium funkei]
MSANPYRLTSRPPRSVPVILLAVLAIAIGGLGVWLLGSYLIDGAWPAGSGAAVDPVGATRFGSTAAQVTAAVVGLVGLILLICAIVPGDPARRAILEDETPGQTAVSRRDLSRRVQRGVEHVDGVQAARVSVRRNRIDVTARTPIEDTETVLRRVRASVDETVAELSPVQALRPRVRIQRTD